ncbi:MAG: hypothetical protein LBO05_04960 [Deltaproteobacteria bacterium]|jgi:hypothetical protein|nr:hypothetical protein [Deltaproteobacteria bacterium]
MWRRYSYFTRKPKVGVPRDPDGRYRPVAIEGRTISRTFWGQRWCAHFESMADYENRLPRGRTYVRNGSVYHLEIGPGKISAKVAGSDLYNVTFDVAPLPLDKWGAILGRCRGHIATILDLLRGTFPPHVMEAVCDPALGLFPLPHEMTYRCSCPDWASMCKHIAAIIYGVASRLDSEPELLFLLRRVDPNELLLGSVEDLAGPAGSGDDSLEGSDLGAIFGVELADPGPAPAPAPPSGPAPAPAAPGAPVKAARPGDDELVERIKKLSELKKTMSPPAAPGKKPGPAPKAPKAPGTRPAPLPKPPAIFPDRPAVVSPEEAPAAPESPPVPPNDAAAAAPAGIVRVKRKYTRKAAPVPPNSDAAAAAGNVRVKRKYTRKAAPPDAPAPRTSKTEAKAAPKAPGRPVSRAVPKADSRPSAYRKGVKNLPAKTDKAIEDAVAAVQQANEARNAAREAARAGAASRTPKKMGRPTTAAQAAARAAAAERQIAAVFAGELPAGGGPAGGDEDQGKKPPARPGRGRPNAAEAGRRERAAAERKDGVLGRLMEGIDVDEIIDQARARRHGAPVVTPPSSGAGRGRPRKKS